MFLTTVLLTGWLALQDPPRPQNPPKPPAATRDATEGSAQVDADLRAAIDELKRSSGYRFEIEAATESGAKRTLAGADEGKPDPQRDEKGDKAGRSDENVAHAKERENVRVTGIFQRERPVQLSTARIEAFRANDKLVWRGRDQKEWMTLPSHVGEPREGAGTDGGTDGGSGTDGDGSNAANSNTGADHRVAMILSQLPLPDDLVRDLDDRLVSCQRATGDAKTGMATYECVVCPTGKEMRKSEGAKIDAKSDPRNCALRFTVTQGRITEMDFRHPAMISADSPNPRNPPNPPTGAPKESDDASKKTGPSITCQYKLSDIGSAQVTVPEDVKRLLGVH